MAIKSDHVQSIKAHLVNPLVIHPRLTELAGRSVSSGLFISQAIYWTLKKAKDDGWFYKTIKDWNNETFLGRYEVEQARKFWRDEAKVLEEKRQGEHGLMHFRVNLEKLEQLLIKTPTTLKTHKEKNSLSEKLAKLNAENSQTPIIGITKTTNREGDTTVSLSGETDMLGGILPAKTLAERMEDLFEKFWWDATPRTGGKMSARKAYTKANPKADAHRDEILRRYFKGMMENDWAFNLSDAGNIRYVPYVSTTLNSNNWMADIPEIEAAIARDAAQTNLELPECE